MKRILSHQDNTFRSGFTSHCALMRARAGSDFFLIKYVYKTYITIRMDGNPRVKNKEKTLWNVKLPQQPRHDFVRFRHTSQSGKHVCDW